MPAPDFDIEEAKKLQKQLGLELDSQGANVQQEDVDALMRLDKAIDDYYQNQRKVDASGKLLAEPETKTPSIVGSTTGGNHHFHFEPSVDQVVKLVKANPELIDKFHLQHWMRPATPPLSMPMVDENTGRVVGGNTQPSETYLDKMTSGSKPYRDIANWIWEEKAKEAAARGDNLRRYKDAHLRGNGGSPDGYANPVDFLMGGLEYNIDRRLAPAALGAADANSMGMASPLYDAARDLADYELSQLPPQPGNEASDRQLTDPMSGMPITGPDGQPAMEREGSFLPREVNLPSSQELQDRSPLSYMAGGFAGYGTSFNPANAIQEQIGSKILGYAPGGGVGGFMANTLIKAPLVGAATNVIEGAARDYANDLARVGSRQGDWNAGDFGEAAEAIPAGIIPNALWGGGISAATEPIAHAANAYRKGFEFRNPLDIKNLRLAGGETSVVHGMKAPKEVDNLVEESLKDNTTGSPGAIAADRLAPRIKQSLSDQKAALVKKTGEDREAYFNHPVYGQLKAKGTRLVNALIEKANEDAFNSPVTNTPGNMNPGLVLSVSRELGGSPWAEPAFVPKEQTADLVSRTGGVVVDPETAVRLFGELPEDYRPGQDIVVVPHEFTARQLYGKEQEVDRILKMHNKEQGPVDPVYERLNEALKDTRDDFPMYRDEAGNLVSPPEPESPVQPFSRAADVPSNEPAPPPPPGEGVGKYPAPIDLRGTSLDDVPAPESSPGIGGPQPGLPSNPFDPRGRVQSGLLDEAIRPKSPVEVQGDYAEPPYIYNEPEAIPGVGPRRDAGQLQGVARPDQLVPNQSIDVAGGESFEPPRIYPDEPPAIETPRMPLEQPREPRSLDADQYMALDDKTPLSMMVNGIEPRPQGNEAGIRYHGKPELKIVGGTEHRPWLMPEEGKYPYDRLNDASREEIRKLSQRFPEGKKIPSKEWTDALEEMRSRTVPDWERSGLTVEQLAHIHGHIEGFGGGKNHVSQGMLDAMLEDPSVVKRDPRAVAVPRQFLGEHLDESIQREPTERIPRNEPVPPESFSPGREARSNEAARMGEPTGVQQAYEEAEAQLRKVEDRLGPYDDETRQVALLDLVKQKLGRDVTMDEITQVNSPKGGPVGMFLLPLFDRFFGQSKGQFADKPTAKPPTQPEVTLDNGKTIKGFSAFRHEQHQALNDMADRISRAGGNSDKTMRERIIGFNKGDDKLYDEVLREEARKIGAEKELWQASLAAERAQMAEKNLMGQKGGGGGDRSRAIGLLGPRLHHVTSVLSGHPRNPYAAGPDGLGEQLFRTLLANPSRRLLDISGGKSGARFGNDAERIYDALSEQYYSLGPPPEQEKDQP